MDLGVRNSFMHGGKKEVRAVTEEGEIERLQKRVGLRKKGRNRTGKGNMRGGV